MGTPVPGRRGAVGTRSRVPSRARPPKVTALGGSSGRALSNEMFTAELKLKPLKNRSALLSLRALHHSIFTLVLPRAPAAELSLPSSNLFLLTPKLRLRSAGETPHLPPAGGRTAPSRRADPRDQTPPGPARCKLAGVGHAGKPLRGKEPWLENPGSHRGPVGPAALPPPWLPVERSAGIPQHGGSRCSCPSTVLSGRRSAASTRARGKPLTRSGEIPGSGTAPGEGGSSSAGPPVQRKLNHPGQGAGEEDFPPSMGDNRRPGGWARYTLIGASLLCAA